MSRHNRRRTRIGQKVPFSTCQANSFGSTFTLAETLEPRFPASRHASCYGVSAKLWHNRYNAWQVREKKQREERESLKQDQRRIFGGDSQDGDDEDALCKNMLDFFVAMDYLEG